MNNQPWSKAKLQEWQDFWESEMGKEAILKMQSIKEQCLNLAMSPTDPNVVSYYVGRASGIDLVLKDIHAGTQALNELKKKEDSQKKKD